MSQVRDILTKAIRKMAASYEQSPDNIQLSFGLNEFGKLHCLVYAAGAPHTHKLSDLIGNNFYNMAVESHLKKKISNIALDNGYDPTDTGLRAMLPAGGEVQVMLYVGGKPVREVQEAELRA